MEGNILFADLLDASRKVTIEWMATLDCLTKEPTYLPHEQLANDNKLEKVKSLASKAIKNQSLQKCERLIHSAGVKGKMMHCLGTGVMWLILHSWSQVFIAKSKQHLSDPHKWLRISLHFEFVLKKFNVWIEKVYPQCGPQERMKATRMIWIATFLEILTNHLERVQYEPIFACALLYPLIDDYLDTEPDVHQRVQFATSLKNKIQEGSSNNKSVATETWDLPHPEFKLIGKLVGIFMQFLHPSSNSRDIAIRIIVALIDLEVEKRPTDLLYAATCKGGFTLCIIHLLVKGSLRRTDVSFMMRLGLALQIVDDLQDLQEDLVEQTCTIVTELHLTSSELKSQYARAINFIRHGIFPEKPWKTRLNLEEGIVTVLKESLVLLCLEAANSCPALLPQDRLILSQHCPLSGAFLRSHPIEATLHQLISLAK